MRSRMMLATPEIALPPKLWPTNTTSLSSSYRITLAMSVTHASAWWYGLNHYAPNRHDTGSTSPRSVLSALIAATMKLFRHSTRFELLLRIAPDTGLRHREAAWEGGRPPKVIPEGRPPDPAPVQGCLLKGDEGGLGVITPPGSSSI